MLSDGFRAPQVRNRRGPFGGTHDSETWRIPMNCKILSRAVCIFMVSVLAVGGGALAQPWSKEPSHFRGVINDYTPASGIMPAGPWEVRGPWSLKVKGCKADFSAELTMVLSDYSRNPSNTHHITMEDVGVTELTTGGFEVSGPVTITKDGGPVPFGASTLVIDITGGTEIEFSNIKLTFGGGAIVHFGTEAFHGVISKDE
jgi:hypothetical protein